MSAKSKHKETKPPSQQNDTSPVVYLTPDDPTSKLMYYFDCICSVLNFDNDNSFVKLRNYYKRKDLTDEERLKLFIFCAVLEPRVLLDKCIFAEAGLCNGYGNRFLKRGSPEWKGLHPPESIEVGGKTVTLTDEVMVFKESWMMRNFVIPFAKLARDIDKDSNGKKGIITYREDKDNHKRVSFGDDKQDTKDSTNTPNGENSQISKVPSEKEKDNKKSKTCVIL